MILVRYDAHIVSLWFWECERHDSYHVLDIFMVKWTHIGTGQTQALAHAFTVHAIHLSYKIYLHNLYDLYGLRFDNKHNIHKKKQTKNKNKKTIF